MGEKVKGAGGGGRRKAGDKDVIGWTDRGRSYERNFMRAALIGASGRDARRMLSAV